MAVTGWKGGGSVLTVPEEIEGLPVTAVGRKAFLRSDMLERVVLPETVTRLEDYAFAQCGRLREVLSPSKVSLGTGVFKGCKSMERLALENVLPDAQILLAALCCRMKADYLLNDMERGSERWFARWDQRLCSFLTENDEESYHDLVFCGEEDIGIRMQDQMMDERKQKAYLCFLRLMNPAFLDETGRGAFAGYLCNHTKDCVSEEAWQVLREQFTDQIACYRLFAKIGGIHEDNLEGMLADLDEAHAEARAFLIRYKEENFQKRDVFGRFAL
ncbi:MAG: leucine-rich repeat domain-containing protein [Lachnospiraceae bacterium]|nr:leucine-rich repeat domain-containing protein [Lachnospiraceae bacterium]